MLTDILQPTHLIIILIVALAVLGPKRVPEAGRALGQGLNESRPPSAPGTTTTPTPQQPALLPTRSPRVADRSRATRALKVRGAFGATGSIDGSRS
jgi:sec-independent protein translocase protein TatA